MNRTHTQWKQTYIIYIYIYMATCLPSRKLSKSDESDMQVTAGEAGTS